VGRRGTGGVKSIWRLIAWHARELWVRILWWALVSAVGSNAKGHPRKVLFVSGADGSVQRGIAFDDPGDYPATNEPRILVVYLRYSIVSSRTEEGGAFFALADRDRLWIDGWGKKDAEALQAAQALE
jgi:hypothetical protein